MRDWVSSQEFVDNCMEKFLVEIKKKDQSTILKDIM